VHAVGGHSYRQCLTEILERHGHAGLYKGFASGLVRPCQCLYSFTGAQTNLLHVPSLMMAVSARRMHGWLPEQILPGMRARR
jgi:hypothetical protein